MADFDYEKELAIDPHMLDEEWLMHPQKYFLISKSLAEAQKDRDKAKEHLDIVKAELDSDIRKDPGKYELAKITEAVVSSTIIQQTKFIEAQNEYDRINYDVNIKTSGVRTFDHRKKALENLVQLHIASYFAGPKEPRNLPPGKRMIDAARDKVSDKQREALTKSRRRK